MFCDRGSLMDRVGKTEGVNVGWCSDSVTQGGDEGTRKFTMGGDIELS